MLNHNISRWKEKRQITWASIEDHWYIASFFKPFRFIGWLSVDCPFAKKMEFFCFWISDVVLNADGFDSFKLNVLTLWCCLASARALVFVSALFWIFHWFVIKSFRRNHPDSLEIIKNIETDSWNRLKRLNSQYETAPWVWHKSVEFFHSPEKFCKFIWIECVVISF